MKLVNTFDSGWPTFDSAQSAALGNRSARQAAASFTSSVSDYLLELFGSAKSSGVQPQRNEDVEYGPEDEVTPDRVVAAPPDDDDDDGGGGDDDDDGGDDDDGDDDDDDDDDGGCSGDDDDDDDDDGGGG